MKEEVRNSYKGLHSGSHGHPFLHFLLTTRRSAALRIITRLPKPQELRISLLEVWNFGSEECREGGEFPRYEPCIELLHLLVCLPAKTSFSDAMAALMPQVALEEAEGSFQGGV